MCVCLVSAGEHLQGLRRPASLTAPVLSSQDWHQLPRGVANLDQNGLTQYISSEHIYPKQPLPSAMPAAPTYVNQPLSNIDLIRLQHEAVKQSVEANTYPRERVPVDMTYQQGDWVTHEGQPSLASTYSQPTSDPYSLPREDLVSSGSLPHDNVLTQQVLSGLETLEISGAYSSGSSYPSTGSDLPSSQPPPTSVSAAVCTAANTSAMPPTSSSSSETVEGVVTTSSQGELQAEIERLRKQVLQHQQTIQRQNAQLQYAGGAATAGGGVVQSTPAPAAQYGSVATTGGGVVRHAVVAPTHHYGGVVQQTAVAPTAQYGGVATAGGGVVTPTPQYSSGQHHVYGSVVMPGDEMHVQPVATPTSVQQYNKQLQAAAVMAAAIVNNPQPNTAQYYPSPGSTLSTAPAPQANTYPPQPQRWSGPQVGGGVTPYTAAAVPGTNYVVQTPYVVPSSTITRQPPPLVVSPGPLTVAT